VTWNATYKTRPSAQQTIKPAAVLIGIHLDSPQQAAFRGIEVEIDNLTAWSRISGLSAKLQADGPGQPIPMAYHLDQPAPVTAQVGDTTITLTWAGTATAPPRKAMLDGNHVHIHEKAVARITTNGPASWNSFHDTVSSLQDLLTLASRFPCAVRSMTLLADQDSRTRRIELLHPTVPQPQENQQTDARRFLFTLDGHDLGELLQRWTVLRQKVGMGIGALFGLDYLPDSFYENKLFNAAGTAEAIHRALLPEDIDLPPEVYKQAIETIDDEVADKAARDWIRGRLRNEPGIKRRLRRLASIPDQQAVTELLTDIDTWAKWTGNARNAVGHIDDQGLNKIPEDARYLLASLTSALAHLVLLQHLGVSADAQRRAACDIYGAPARAFRREIDKLNATPS